LRRSRKTSATSAPLLFGGVTTFMYNHTNPTVLLNPTHGTLIP
jgi:hypothetical protein